MISILEQNSKLSDQNTNPALVVIKNQPSYSIYQRAVKDIITIDEMLKILKKIDGKYVLFKNGRGVIGATAAIAWSPKREGKTYELITYREPGRWGTKREIDDDTVKEMDKIYTTTFDNYDYLNHHNRIKPNSPCPILYGIRGLKPDDLIKACKHVKSEKVNSWLIFETNQGTDDHIQRKKVNEVKPYQSVLIKGEVAEPPFTIKGGHVIIKIKDETGVIDCAAYEPTKQFRNIIRNLIPGDRLEVYGGVREQPLTVNMEKIKVIRLKKHVIKKENPICQVCGKHMKSIGKNQGYRCVICGVRDSEPLMEESKRGLKTGFYEVPVCARRHLSKPVKLITPLHKKREEG
jgi:tRNA(Ile2)-agmatinylcytidine synthase